MEVQAIPLLNKTHQQQYEQYLAVYMRLSTQLPYMDFST